MKKEEDQTETCALFVTCLVDLLRPEIGLAALKLVQATGARIVAPRRQTCCGQPAFNGGDPETARKLALHHMELFQKYDRIIVPSASCAGMMKIQYPQLFAKDPKQAKRAQGFAHKIYELTQYLALKKGEAKKDREKRVCHHDSCSALREMRITQEPRALMQAKGLSVAEAADPYSCCGFGGTFSSKFPEIAHKMACEKLAALEASGASFVSSCDYGCLLHLQGTAEKLGKTLTFRHVAELLEEE